MKFCRINLSKTNYNVLKFGHHMSMSERDSQMDILQSIYRKYCNYKKFTSVMPLFHGIIFDKNTDVIAYYPEENLCAFSIVKKYDIENAESLQFAWDYSNPDIKLGIASLEHECAYYKNKGFKYLYLGLADNYKSQLDGYEILGPLT
jgi:hypothetical protein